MDLEPEKARELADELRVRADACEPNERVKLALGVRLSGDKVVELGVTTGGVIRQERALVVGKVD